MAASKTACKSEISITFAYKIKKQLFQSHLPKQGILVMFSMVYLTLNPNLVNSKVTSQFSYIFKISIAFACNIEKQKFQSHLPKPGILIMISMVFLTLNPYLVNSKVTSQKLISIVHNLNGPILHFQKYMIHIRKILTFY